MCHKTPVGIHVSRSLNQLMMALNHAFGTELMDDDIESIIDISRL